MKTGRSRPLIGVDGLTGATECAKTPAKKCKQKGPVTRKSTVAGCEHRRCDTQRSIPREPPLLSTVEAFPGSSPLCGSNRASLPLVVAKKLGTFGEDGAFFSFPMWGADSLQRAYGGGVSKIDLACLGTAGGYDVNIPAFQNLLALERAKRPE